MSKMVFHRGSARMFQSDFFEFFSRVHPITPWVLFLPILLASAGAALFHYQVPAGTVAWQVALGYLGWTLVEYWLHRLFFHLPVRGPITERIYFFVHGVHHDWPWDHSRLVMPPAVSLSLGVIFYFGLRSALDPGAAHALFAGLVVGYLIYDSVHWMTHARAPKNRWFKYLRRQHLVHHFKEPQTRFGVSCPWWDFVFGTAGR